MRPTLHSTMSAYIDTAGPPRLVWLAKRVAKTADRIFAALEPNCRTIVVNAADRFALPRKEKRQNSMQSKAFPMVEMGDSRTPDPLHAKQTTLEADRAYETQEIAHFPYSDGFFEAEFSSASVRAFR